MRKLLIRLCLVFSVGLAHGGAYEDILNAAEKSENATVVDLLRRGMDVNSADPSGNTLVMIAARNANLELLDFLLNNRAGVNRRNRFGDTAMLLAAVKGSLAAMRLLSEHGGELEPGGWSALHYAVFGQNQDLLAWVIAQKPKLDARAPNGQTALMLASKIGNLEFVRMLVDADADMDLADYDGATAVSLARKAGHLAVADYLHSVGAVE